MSGNYKDWLNSLALLNNKRETNIRKKTSQQYNEVKEKGFETVIWEEFNLTNLEDLVNMQNKVKIFIEENKPCLFIYDPLKPHLIKNFILPVLNYSQVEEWLKNNEKNLFNYSYLITSLISTERYGYLGSVHSDGKGNLLIETYHEKGASNHRILSQNIEKNNLNPYLDFILVNNFEIVSQKSKWLNVSEINKIIDLYGFTAGVFDFIKGEQLKKLGFYTIDINDVSFPNDLFDSLHFDNKSKLNYSIRKKQP